MKRVVPYATLIGLLLFTSASVALSIDRSPSESTKLRGELLRADQLPSGWHIGNVQTDQSDASDFPSPYPQILGNSPPPTSAFRRCVSPTLRSGPWVTVYAARDLNQGDDFLGAFFEESLAAAPVTSREQLRRAVLITAAIWQQCLHLVPKGSPSYEPETTLIGDLRAQAHQLAQLPSSAILQWQRLLHVKTVLDVVTLSGEETVTAVVDGTQVQFLFMGDHPLAGLILASRSIRNLQ